MDAPSFTYDNKIITVTHDMVLHITYTIPDQGVGDFQMPLTDSTKYYMELMHIIFTKLISKVSDNLTFKIYLHKIPSCMVPYKFAKDALEILKPLILENNQTRSTYERYFLNGKEEEEYNKEIKSPFKYYEEKEEEEKPSMFDLSDSDDSRNEEE